VGEALVRRQAVTDLRATILVKEDELTIEEGHLAIWGGTLSLAGTRARLEPADRPFTVSARAVGVQAGSALATWSDKQVLTGRLDAEVRLSGKGETTAAIEHSLDGTVDGRLLDGIFHGKDLVAAISDPLVKAMPALRRTSRGGKTGLGKVLPFSLRVERGRVLLQKPLQVEDRDATATVRGSVGLDGELEMPVTLALLPEVVSELTGGKAQLREPLPFSFTLQGKAWSPRLAGLEVGPAARVIAETLGAQALGKALGLPATPSGAKEQARGKADEARKKLEQDAKKALKKVFGG
jgi:AsmA protein